MIFDASDKGVISICMDIRGQDLCYRMSWVPPANSCRKLKPITSLMEKAGEMYHRVSLCSFVMF